MLKSEILILPLSLLPTLARLQLQLTIEDPDIAILFIYRFVDRLPCSEDSTMK